MNHRLKFCLSFALINMLFVASVTSFAQARKDSNNSNEQSHSRGTDWENMDTITTTVQIDAGEKFYIYYDAENSELKAMPPVTLPDECKQALGMVPSWLKDNLTYKFRQLTPSKQVTYANLIINAPDSKYIDEIAFCIAHMSVESLQHQYFFPQLITDNAQIIYQNDQYLDYVDIVEKGDYTTVSYKNKTNVSLELPRDIYYWYIVHPKVSDELPTYVDPDYNYYSQQPRDRNYGVAPPTGKFWRDWLFYHNDSANQSGNNKANPLLKDLLLNSNTVWEGISAINSWVSNSMKFTSNNERPVQPVRIYRKHIGRCGEHQDIRCAAARAALIPSTCTLNSAEDHVWDEFWDQRWIHWDGDRDNPMKYEKNWGKKISSVWNCRGDGHIWSVTPRYTSTCTFTVTVLDSTDKPVDGAEVWILTENYYNSSLLTITTWGYTDSNGTCTFTLGDDRNYWACVETDNLGETPPDQGGTEQVTRVINNAGTGNYSHTFKLPKSAPSLSIDPGEYPIDATKQVKMEISFDVITHIVQGKNVYTDEHCDLWTLGGNIDFFIADAANYSEYNDSGTFSAFELASRKSSNGSSFVLPSNDDWYAVFSNEFSQRSTKIINITIKIYGALTAKITSPVHDTELALDDEITITGTAFSPLSLTGIEVDINNKNNWQTANDVSGGQSDIWTKWEFEWPMTGLQPGKYNIRVRAADAKYTFITSINVILIDINKPVVVINQPFNNSVFRIGEVIIITGTANDNIGVKSVEFIFDDDLVNKINITSSIRNGEWSHELETTGLSDGPHLVTVQAIDGAKNVNSSKIQINLLEIISPIVSIITPDNHSIHKLGDTVYLEGTTTDNKGVTTVELIINSYEPINITADLNNKGKWYHYWDTGKFSSDEGVYNIEVRACDAVQNIGFDNITLSLDNSPPELSITAPDEDEIYSSGDRIFINGTVSDNIGLAKLELNIDDRILLDITPEVFDNAWSFEISDSSIFSSGKHEIIVQATDFVGFTKVESMVFKLDFELPVVKISRIPEPVLIGQSILFQGSVYDDIGIKNIMLTIDKDEPMDITAEHLNPDNTWSYSWNTTGMAVGVYEITASVTDVVDKQIAVNIYVNLISLTTDTDSDGMPDWWELLYPGLDYNKNDADEDLDRDGILNINEYLGDDGEPGNDDYSDPNDKSSTPEIKNTKSAERSDDSFLTGIILLNIILIIILVMLLLIFMKKGRKGDAESDTDQAVIHATPTHSDLQVGKPQTTAIPQYVPMRFPTGQGQGMMPMSPPWYPWPTKTVTKQPPQQLQKPQLTASSKQPKPQQEPQPQLNPILEGRLSLPPARKTVDKKDN